jgi:hypothetical protein
MKKLVLMILLVALVGISSLGLAFDVMVSVQDQDGGQTGQYRVVEMQPVLQDTDVAAADPNKAVTTDEALIAEKN